MIFIPIGNFEVPYFYELATDSYETSHVQVGVEQQSLDLISEG